MRPGAAPSRRARTTPRPGHQDGQLVLFPRRRTHLARRPGLLLGALAAAALTATSACSAPPTSGPAPQPSAVSRARVTTAARGVAPALRKDKPVTIPAAVLDRPVPPRATTADGHPVAYLTFDDGPSPTWTPQVLALLARHHAHATFFAIGSRSLHHPELVRAELAAGDAVGDHTWTHPHLTRLTQAQVAKELTDGADFLHALGAPSRCFRPPFGETDPAVVAVADRLHLHQYLWTTESKDWTHAPAAQDLQRARAGLRPGAIIVFHDGDGSGSAQSVAALGELLDAAAQQGYVLSALPC